MKTHRDQDALRVATMYYLQDLKMEVIARHLGTSRSTVSRLLKQARESGLVEITLNRPWEREDALARAITATFGVETYVIQTPALATEPEQLDEVAKACGRLLPSWFESEMVLGVAWGRTTSAIAERLVAKRTHDSVVVQLNGAASIRSSGMRYAGQIISAFADAYGAQVQDFPVPAFFDYPETKQAMWRERAIRRILDVQSQVDVALFSVGSFAGSTPSHVYSAGYLEALDLAELEAAGVVGDVCTVFLRDDGTYQDIELNERATGPNPAQLRTYARRVCVVAGQHKVLPLLGALRAGVATDVIIDDRLAAQLVEVIRARKKAGLAIGAPR